MVIVGWHSRLRRYARAIALIPLYVALICQGLLRVHGHIGHVVSRHVRVLGHARSVPLGRNMLVGRLFGRVDLISTIDAVLAALGGLGCVEARLEKDTG